MDAYSDAKMTVRAIAEIVRWAESLEGAPLNVIYVPVTDPWSFAGYTLSHPTGQGPQVVLLNLLLVDFRDLANALLHELSHVWANTLGSSGCQHMGVSHCVQWSTINQNLIDLFKVVNFSPVWQPALYNITAAEPSWRNGLGVHPSVCPEAFRIVGKDVACHRSVFPFDPALTSSMPFTTCRPKALLDHIQPFHPEVQPWMDEMPGAPRVWHRPSLGPQVAFRVQKGTLFTATKFPGPVREDWMVQDKVWISSGGRSLIHPWYGSLFECLPSYFQGPSGLIPAIGPYCQSVPKQSERRAESGNDSDSSVAMSGSPDLKCRENGADFLYEDTPTSEANHMQHGETKAAEASPLPRLRLSDLVGAWQDDLANSTPTTATASNGNDVNSNDRAATSRSPYGGHVGHYPPDLWEEFKVVEDAARNVHYYKGPKSNVMALRRPLFLTATGRFSVWGLPWEGGEDEVYPLYGDQEQPSTLYVLKPAFGWGCTWRGNLPAPVKVLSTSRRRVITLYAVWHSLLGLPTMDRDVYELEDNGLLVISSDPEEFVPSTLKPIMVGSLDAYDYYEREGWLTLHPITVPLAGATPVNSCRRSGTHS